MDRTTPVKKKRKHGYSEIECKGTKVHTLQAVATRRDRIGGIESRNVGQNDRSDNDFSEGREKRLGPEKTPQERFRRVLRRAPAAAAAGSSSPPPPPSAIASLLRFLPLPPPAPAAGPLRDEAVEARLWIELAGEARLSSSSARRPPPPEEAVGVSAGEVTSYAWACC